MKINLIVLCAEFFLFVLTSLAYAQIRLLKYISICMVLQQAQSLKIGSWVSPAEKVSIAEGYKEFVWAEARINDNEVVVSNNEIADLKYVGYAWSIIPTGQICITRGAFRLCLLKL